MSRIAWRLVPDKSVIKRLLKWFVIINAVLAAFGIVVGGNAEFVGRVHGSSFLLVVSAAGLASIELGKTGDRLKVAWFVGSVCVLVTGVSLLALTWGAPLPDGAGKPVGTAAVIGVVATYCALISLICSRNLLRNICWSGALLHGLYVAFLIWFEITPFPGRILALFAVAQSACSLLAVIEFIGSRRTGSLESEPSERVVKFCPYCGATDLNVRPQLSECRKCEGKFRTFS